MFFHIYKNRLKCIVRDRQMMFWTILFPIILGTLFHFAFQNLTSGEAFSRINIAVVDNADFQQNAYFKDMLMLVSGEGENQAEDALFTITYTSEEDVANLLHDSKVEGVILCGEDIHLAVRQTGINQTIIKSFLDDYKQSQSTIAEIMQQNPAGAQALFHDIAARTDYLKNKPVNKSVSNPTTNYFYTLIGMACLYGGFLGLKEVTAIQANLSAQGARVNVAPTHKMKVFCISMAAAVTVQLIEIFILMLYLIFVLKVDFGNQLPYIALTCVTGTLTGAAFGAMLAAVVKGREGIKTGVLIASTMTMSFLSGMMIMDMKYIISNNVPFLAKINPANLITDSFYSLYYYTTHTAFFTDIAILWGLSVVFSIIGYLVLRRQRYASL